jgi:hypothetical protein
MPWIVGAVILVAVIILVRWVMLHEDDPPGPDKRGSRRPS